MVQHPGDRYLGHITVDNGTAETIKRTIVKFMDDNFIETDRLLAVGCDGTAVNTGIHRGVIRLLELENKSALHWFVCLLHANELPLRHLIEKLDGATSGPRGYSGPIGKLLNGCSDSPIVNFKPISFNRIPEVDLLGLSTDQKYLLEICQAVASGHCSTSLSRKNPGKMSHARWLTKANRILRLYISTAKPSLNLKLIVDYIMKFYAPVWFWIKSHPSCKDGAKHLWRMMSFSRTMTESVKKIIDPIIQRNGFFGHPENILLGMIADKRWDIRKIAIKKILHIRGAQGSSIRKFNIPPLNFAAADYSQLISWTYSKLKLTEPPLLSRLSDGELRNLLNNDIIPAYELFQLPCHTQAVERTVKIVTEASSAVCGPQNRDGFIRTRLQSRKLMPSFHTKKDYQVMQNDAQATGS